MSSDRWLIAIDRGGTFTDVVAHGPTGEVRSGKVLARAGSDLEGVAAAVGMDRLPDGALLRVGTTVGTNALLTNTGALTAALVTEGLEDLSWIGHQTRPDIFALDIVRSPSIARWVVPVRERLGPAGEVVMALDHEFARDRLGWLRAQGCESIVIVFAHAVRNPSHELAVADLAAESGFREVVMSHRVLPRAGFVDRLQAATVDGAITPVVEEFARRVSGALPVGHTRFMTSDGALAGPERFRGKDSLLSGPAGGVAACARIGREFGVSAVLGFDMGGTSTDVCRWAGAVERTETCTIGERVVPLPAVDLVTVAAGGGSRLTMGDGRVRVGPESVGADPGPACYGLGDQAAITDANVVLGRVQPGWVPAVFGPSAAAPLDAARARAAVARAAGVDPRDEDAVLDAAAGFVSVADQAMSEAIAQVSRNRGHDPRAHALLALGGAGPQHACSVAELLGIERVLVHPMAGVLSAWGIAGAAASARHEAPIGEDWSAELVGATAGLREELTDLAHASLRGDGEDGEPTDTARWTMRYRGADAVLEAGDRAEFEREHERLFGFRRPEDPVEVLTLRVTASVPGLAPPRAAPSTRARPGVRARVSLSVARGGARQTSLAPVIDWERLSVGSRVLGPALVVGTQTSVVVDPGWELVVGRDQLLDLRWMGRPPAGHWARGAVPPGPDPVGLALHGRRIMSVAERMGETLRRVARSTNIRERLDFSCAVFDAHGGLLANAPHIPVHLGAMGETVRGLARSLPASALRPGRSWAVNDPAQGGSHLPDITVVTPVFPPGGTAPFAWVASRGHHADVGGVSAGSMPPFSTRLDEEGVVLRGLLLVSDGTWRDAAISDALDAGPFPTRDPATVHADLQAQVAANRVGVVGLTELHRALGGPALEAWSGWILDNGDEVLRGWLDSFGDGTRRCADRMDDGTPIVVGLRRSTGPRGPVLSVDFEGTGPRSAGNLNAPRAVVRAALLYVLRCVMGRDIPLNEGVLRSVDLRIPPGCLLDPAPGSAVVGGNVETSQRLVDVLLGALGAAAASQGTMNNLCLGTSRGSYYETIGGGAGATPSAAGADGVQVHMTNTRMTDPEVLEQRHPVLITRFGARKGSGGAGRHRGGDGLVREVTFFEPVTASLLAQRRVVGPFGLAGGRPGATGRAERVRDGVITELPPCFEATFLPGDTLRVLTPGGGGYGVQRPPPHTEEL
jgi:5-oxoprolinase (ATP-hydrolysing)